MAASGYTPISIYHSTTASAAPTAGNLVNGELAINILDGKLYYKDSGGTVQVIATKGTGTIGGSTTQVQYNNAGALAGSANFTFDGTTATINTLNLTNALGAAYGGTAQSTYAQGDLLYASAANTLAKLPIGISTYILTSNGTIPVWAIPSSVVIGTATNLAGGAAGSVPYQSGASTTTFLSIGTANQVITSTGTAPQWSSSLTLTGLSNSGLTTLDKTVTVGNTSFNGAAVFAPSTPAKVYLGTGTVTDVTSAIAATNAAGAIVALGITPIAATNANVTYTNASTLYIAGAPSAGTNITITNPYALYVAAGDAYFGASVSATSLKSSIAGTNAAPVFSYTSDTNTGIFFPAADKLGFVAGGGSDQMVLTTTGLGIGTSSPGARLQVTSAVSGSYGAIIYNTHATGQGLTVRGGSTSSQDAFNVQTYDGGTSLLSVQAGGNVGIGTSSPAVKLDVTGAGQFNSSGEALTVGSSALAANTAQYFRNTSGYGVLALTSASDQYLTGVVAGDFVIASNAKSLRFGNAGTGVLQATLDSSGNLGLGVTPSAWPGQSAGYYVSQFGNAAFYGLSTNEARMAANAFVDAIGTNRYISSGYATRHDQKDGVYIWRTAPSGTANSTTIVINNEYTIVTAGGNFTAFGAANNNVGTVFTATSSGTATGGAATQTIVFTQAMTLDASGNLGVGNTSPTSYNSAADNLVIGSSGSNGMTIVSGTTGAGYIMFADGTVGQQAYEGQITYDHASNFMAFNTSGGERARITSGGYFKASDNGTYNNAAGLYHELYQSTVETATVISAVNASFANNILQLNAARNTTNNSFYALSYYNSGAGAYKLRVADSGAIGTAGSITLGSITPATSGIGVQFPATQSASSDANTLDDYEEGTFDPEVTFGGGSTSLTYTTKTGFYRKIGSLVFFSFRIVLSAKGSSTGLAKISIPFPAANIGRPGGANLMYGVDFTTVTAAETTIDTDQNASIASLYTITAGAALTDANFQNTTDFIAAFCYISA